MLKSGKQGKVEGVHWVKEEIGIGFLSADLNDPQEIDQEAANWQNEYTFEYWRFEQLCKACEFSQVKYSKQQKIVGFTYDAFQT